MAGQGFQLKLYGATSSRQGMQEKLVLALTGWAATASTGWDGTGQHVGRAGLAEEACCGNSMKEDTPNSSALASERGVGLLLEA